MIPLSQITGFCLIIIVKKPLKSLRKFPLLKMIYLAVINNHMLNRSAVNAKPDNTRTLSFVKNLKKKKKRMNILQLGFWSINGVLIYEMWSKVPKGKHEIHTIVKFKKKKRNYPKGSNKDNNEREMSHSVVKVINPFETPGNRQKRFLISKKKGE